MEKSILFVGVNAGASVGVNNECLRKEEAISNNSGLSSGINAAINTNTLLEIY